ncbi:MAG: starch-binding protein [Bacteroides sp. SM23_62]|nr:MAG: starch-binding protein [Bacteroides sp. SM23_62]
MKKYLILLTVIFLALTACESLDLNPLSEGSSETWFSTREEIRMALNDLYRQDFWYMNVEDNGQGSWTDDWTSRNVVSEITGGTINGEWGVVINRWRNSYKAITRANTILANLDKTVEDIPQVTLDQFAAEARFARAGMYSFLISHYGDVPYYTQELDIDEAFTMGRTDKNTILQAIYDDYDYAIANLPESFASGQSKRATKGAAMGMKARIALYNEDWATAREAAKACMDLEVHSLHPDFRELFLTSTKNPSEIIFAIPRSVTLGVSIGSSYPIRATITRNAGGWGSWNPSWDLLAAFLCTDGLPIDESPLFNPRDPFANRDPRCNETIVPFETEHLGFMYQPHPDTLQVLNFKTGSYQQNNDNRVNAQYASYNALIFRKFVDEDWSDDRQTDPDNFILRYADVLLMYAEASIELGQIDQSVLDAINMVRARAYKVSIDQTDDYPAVTTTDQAELRKVLRIERRMEFVWEGLRYMDLIRWKLAEKALTTTIYGMLDPADLQSTVIPQGLWFWSETPQVDEDGIADFTPMFNAGYCKVLAIRKFDASRQYLWPIPSKEILINENIKQNPGY